MRRGVASLRDDSPSASAKGAKSAKGDRLVVQVEVVGLDDGVVALVLPKSPIWRLNSGVLDLVALSLE